MNIIDLVDFTHAFADTKNIRIGFCRHFFGQIFDHSRVASVNITINIECAIEGCFEKHRKLVQSEAISAEQGNMDQCQRTLILALPKGMVTYSLSISGNAPFGIVSAAVVTPLPRYVGGIAAATSSGITAVIGNSCGVLYLRRTCNSCGYCVEM